MVTRYDVTNIKTIVDLNKLDMSRLSPGALPDSIFDAIWTSAKRFPNKVAIKYILDGDCLGKDRIPVKKKIIHQTLKLLKGKTFAAPYREITFSQLAHSVTQTANALRLAGIEKDDVTSIVMPNFPETYSLLWGASTAGIANPINPLLEANIIKEIVLSAKSKILVALGPVPGSDIWQKIVSIKDQIPGLKTVVSVFGDNVPAKNQSEVPVISLKNFIKGHNSTQLNFIGPKQDDLCAYFHTGGTTGLPKLAKHQHLNQLTNAAQVNLISPLTQKDTMLIGLPIFHVNAAVATGLSSIMLGSTILMASPAGYRGKNIFDNLLSILDNFQVAFMMGVPTVYAGLLENIEKQGDQFKRPKYMKLAICGAAPLSPKLQQTFSAKMGVPLIEGYGSTEGSSVSTLMPVHDVATEPAVGLPIPGINIRIADIDEHGELIEFCSLGEVGEIVIAGNNVFPGYVEPDHNQSLWITDKNGQSFVRTGDLGKFDANGYLSLAGRQKELIIRGGHNIDPKMIEDTAARYPGINLAAAVPRPDAYAGELPVLYVTAKDNHKLNQTDLMDFLQANIAERAAIPKAVNVIKDMPLTAVGKIFKPTLVGQEIQRIIESELTNTLSHLTWSVEVLPNKQKGLLATIQIETVAELTKIEQDIQQQLTAYSFKYQIVQVAVLNKKAS